MRSLQKDAIAIMDWFKNNKIKVNASKTKLGCFRKTLNRIKAFPPVFFTTRIVHPVVVSLLKMFIL